MSTNEPVPDPSSEVVERRTVHHEIRSSTSAQPQAYTAVAGPAPSVRQQEPSASSATKELDDLMASLSDFKVKEEPGATSQVAQVVELVRHKPQQPQSGPPSHAAGLAAGGGENAGGGRTLTVRHAHTPAPTLPRRPRRAPPAPCHAPRASLGLDLLCAPLDVVGIPFHSSVNYMKVIYPYADLHLMDKHDKYVAKAYQGGGQDEASAGGGAGVGGRRGRAGGRRGGTSSSAR